MARWSEVMSLAAANVSPVAVVSTVVFFSVCVTMLLVLCAAHSSHHAPEVLNARRDCGAEPDPESPAAGLAIAPPDHFVKSKDPPEELSFRFTSGLTSGFGSGFAASPKLNSAGAVINKLGSSFRTRSFRISTSFRMDSCKQVGVDVVDALRRAREPEAPEPAVWQRVILRGERCAPLSFSGLVLYDENGNLLPPSFGHLDAPSQPAGAEGRQQLPALRPSELGFGDVRGLGLASPPDGEGDGDGTGFNNLIAVRSS